jgi:hypothetical protein
MVGWLIWYKYYFENLFMLDNDRYYSKIQQN